MKIVLEAMLVVAVIVAAVLGMVGFDRWTHYQPVFAAEPKRVVLTQTQTKMIQAIEQDVENVPEVKVLRARENGIMAGIATSAGMNRWSWKTEKGEIVIEEQPEPKEEPKP